MTKLMADTSITKVSVAHSPRGHAGQKYLASGIHVPMRLWERAGPSVAKPKTSRGYETVGFVIEGKAELHIEDQLVLLEKGDFLGGTEGCQPHLQSARNLYRSRSDQPSRGSAWSR